jgi:hypothetical protein
MEHRRILAHPRVGAKAMMWPRMRLLRYLQRGSRGTLESPATILQFSTGLRVRSDLQQAARERDGDCMGEIVGLKFIHQVPDVEVHRGLGIDS